MRDGTTIARSDGSVRTLAPIAVSAAEGEALRGWVMRERAARTIEVGLAYAVSTLYICEALLESGADEIRHVALDPYQASYYGDAGRQVLEEAGVSGLVEFREEESQIALPRFVAEGRAFDLAFVDGSHRFDRAFLDLVYLGRLVRPGGIVFVDDYQLPAIRRAASFCLTNLGWRLEEVSAADELHQWAVLRTSDVPDTRSHEDYIDF